ncbi:MAG: hypothetical protein INR73_22310 [Williamsia sp.]|nr:hypothetical protein [Williamsia sp.]
MKKAFALLAAITVCGYAFTQDTTSYKKPSTLGIQFIFNDFQTPAAIRSSSLAAVLRDKRLAHLKNMSPGLAINYLKGLNSTFDLSTSLEMSFLDYPIQGKAPFGGNNLLLEGTAMINAKMLPDKYYFVPYLSAGLGISKYQGYYGTFLPVGAGVQVNVFDEAFFFINSQYRVKVADNTNYHLFASIGFAGIIRNR